MARDKNTITQSLHGKEVYWERKEGRQKKTDNDLLAQRHRRKRMGVGGACSLKEPLLHLHRQSQGTVCRACWGGSSASARSQRDRDRFMFAWMIKLLVFYIYISLAQNIRFV